MQGTYLRFLFLNEKALFDEAVYSIFQLMIGKSSVKRSKIRNFDITVNVEFKESATDSR